MRLITLGLAGVMAMTMSLAGCQTLPGETNSHPTASTYPVLAAPPIPANTLNLSGQEAVRWLGLYHWRLSGTPMAGAQLDFETALENARIYQGCNRLSASYRSELRPKGLQLTFGQVSSTLMACPSVAMWRDQQIAGWLGRQTFDVIVQPDPRQPRLLLTSASGQTLTFIGEATTEQRYGGPGQTAFLQIQPKKVMCTSIKSCSCLQVREVFYDTQGVKTGYGPWQVLQQDIEGYQPDGSAVILRVKRYSSPDPQTSPVVYVVDQVIEQSAP